VSAITSYAIRALHLVVPVRYNSYCAVLSGTTLYNASVNTHAMGWIKAKLPDDFHDKVKVYRDRTDATNMTEAASSLLQRGIVAYESEHGLLGEGDE